jgi:class 3 adenylate cyclase
MWRRSSPLRVAVWALHVSLPMLVLWLLLARPELDVLWEVRHLHFWMIAGVAGVNVAMGWAVWIAARNHADARLFLISLAFLASAGFFLFHALATPHVVVETPNPGFEIATPLGVIIFAVFAAASAVNMTPRRAESFLRKRGILTGGLVVFLAAWAIFSLALIPPFHQPLSEDLGRPLAIVGATLSLVLFAFAGVRYFQIYRRRPSVMLLSLITAFVLLAQALVVMVLTFGRSWQLSWWEWHLLMVLAFAFVAYSGRVQYRREGSVTAIFSGISLQETIRQIREEHAAALEALVDAMRRGEDAAIGRLAARLGERFDLTEGQTQVLERAAEALAAEREQLRRLGALVAVGREARVLQEERDLMARAVSLLGDAFDRTAIQVGLLREDRLDFPEELRAGPLGDGEPVTREGAEEVLRSLRPIETTADGTAALILPLTVKDRPAGVLEVLRERGFEPRDRSVLESVATQLSISLENARLYRQLDSLFRQYMSPTVATTLLADPGQAALGGGIAEVTVLFADLRGFTSFSERSSPEEIVAMLNRYLGMAVPLVLREGGTVDKFVGDALMAVWGAPVRQPDHALRAARAARAVQEAIEEAAEGRPDWPRFRIGINTGPALVGNIGSDELRNYTVIGDTVNLASRLESSAEPGQVVIGRRTYEAILDAAEVEPLGPISVKGKERPVEAYLLLGIR